jgi:molybdenum cofactor cytidylyltransferase
MTTGILLLAAGSSTRFGSDKRFALMANGNSVIDNTLSQIRTTKLPLMVCLKEADLYLQQLLDKNNIDWVINKNSDRGMGTSLATGINVCAHWQATIIALADMPFVTADSYSRIAKIADRGKIIIPTYHGNKGNPVCFGNEFYSQLQMLTTDKGAKEIVLDNFTAVTEIELADQGILQDIDQPSDL